MRRDTYCFTGVLRCSHANTRLCTRKTETCSQAQFVLLCCRPLVSFLIGKNAIMHTEWLLVSFSNVKHTRCNSPSIQIDGLATSEKILYNVDRAYLVIIFVELCQFFCFCAAGGARKLMKPKHIFVSTGKTEL